MTTESTIKRIDPNAIEGLDEAETEQDETAAGDFGPRLMQRDKELMAENAVPFFIREISIVEGDPKFKKKLRGMPEETWGTLWAIQAFCEKALQFPPVKSDDPNTSRSDELNIDANEEFKFTLTRSPKREPVMNAYHKANGTGEIIEAIIGPVQLDILFYTRNNTPYLSLAPWKPGSGVASPVVEE